MAIVKIDMKKRGAIRRVDRFVDEHVYYPHRGLLKSVDQDAKDLIDALIQSDWGMILSGQLRRLQPYRNIRSTLFNGIADVNEDILDGLRRSRIDFAAMGMRNGAEMISEQLDPARGLTTAALLANVDDVIIQDEGFLVEGGKLQFNYGRMPWIAVDALEDYLAGKGVPSSRRGVDYLVDQAVNNTFSKVLAWTTAMTSLALWNVVMGGMLNLYNANNEIVDGWIWHSRLDSRTCASCLYLHGQFFPLDYPFSDHPHGRCWPVPHLNEDWLYGGDYDDDPEKVEPGTDWWANLTDVEKEELVGSAMWRAMEDGAISLKDIAVEHGHDIYGIIRREASLKEILGADAAKKYYVVPEWNR